MKKRKRNQSGETIVEVMVSVVIFLMLVAMIHTTMNYCYGAQMRSTNVRRELQQIEQFLAVDQTSVALTNEIVSKPQPEKITLKFKIAGQDGGNSVFEIEADQSAYQFSFDTGNKYTFIKLFQKKQGVTP